jgi:large subunit ribosomal protein L13
MSIAKSYMAKAEDVETKWCVIDANGKVLGRLASQVASILQGKHKPIYTPHVDTGDGVIVINADKVVLTGKKLDQKVEYRHSQYPGGFKVTKYRELMQKNPEKVVRKAIVGMLPKNKLGRAMALKLRVYAGPDHPHQAQQPEVLD